ncbi:MAG: UDP-N-acetylmuramoyl-L-alanine--D-glutamate ligase [Ruminococcaceae bacterium]|nr:UDP-N-acetylmuramoyl-L-alanine--D-glutamate ligase [Oscillospiraceae bacterium]
MDNIQLFFERIKGKKVAFCGAGVTNTPMVEMFISKGCDVTVCDKRTADKLGEAAERFEALGAKLKLGDDYLNGIDADIIFRTPGMRFYIPELEQYRQNGVTVTSELEVFLELCPAHIIGITGSNGKTTTSTIIAKTLEADGKKVWLGGNIGKALMPDLERISPDDWVVCEMSSFQLISMRRSPDIALITNITPNHLDMHKDMEEYIDSKKNIFVHQSAFGRAVFNADCPVVGEFVGQQRGEGLTFSRRKLPHWGAYADEQGDIWFSDRGKVRRIMNRSDIRIPGWHNVENYLAAICVLAGIVSDKAIIDTAHLFAGVEHRAEFIRCLDGVSYYNDSIATTPSRCISGTLSMYDRRIIMIAGGYDKKIPFDEMGPVVCNKVKTLILMGVTADKIESAVRGCREFKDSGVSIIRVNSLEEAVTAARDAAEDGDIVSLSPACASFDMFPNFETRGRRFKELVNALRPRKVRFDGEDED